MKYRIQAAEIISSTGWLRTERSGEEFRRLEGDIHCFFTLKGASSGGSGRSYWHVQKGRGPRVDAEFAGGIIYHLIWPGNVGIPQEELEIIAVESDVWNFVHASKKLQPTSQKQVC